MLSAVDPQTELINAAVYSTVDALPRLKVRLQLKQVATSSHPLLSINDSQTQLFQQQDPSLLPVQTLPFQWQEKIASPTQLASIATSSQEQLLGSQTKLSSKKSSLAAKDYQSLLASERQGIPYLYTIIDGDGYVEEAEEIHSSQDFLSNPRSSTKDFKTRLSEQVLRKRRVRKEEANVTSNTEFSGKKTVVAHYSPAMPFENKEHVIQRDPQEPRNLEFPFSEMHVMASFPVIDGDESNKENDASKKTNQNNLTSQSLQTPVEPQKMKRIEKRLLTIRKFQNGILSFTPDVTKKDQKSYRIQVEDQIYDYRIENVSEPMDTLDEEKEMKIYTEFYQKRAEAAQKALEDLKFSVMPEPLSLYVYGYGELVSATGFQGSSLYVKYHIALPEGWYEQWLQGLAGCTQSASNVYDTSNPNNSFLCQFSHPIETALISRDSDNPNYWPKLYCQVYSHDGWDRHVVEGYGYMELPSTPGSHMVEMTTWKPMGDRISRLSSYFLGGSTELDNVEFLNEVHSSKTKSSSNRYGFPTESSGTILLRWNIVHQAQSFAKTVNTGNSSLMPGNLTAISNALVRAKARLKALKSLRETSVPAPSPTTE